MEGTTVSVMATILTAITAVVNASIGWMTSFLGVITAEGNEILLLFVIFGFVGTGVGLLRRLMHV